MTDPKPIAGRFNARAYGCLWQSVFPLPLFQPAQSASAPKTYGDESVVRVLQAAPAERPYSIANGRQRFCADGLRYVADNGTLIDVYGTNRIEILPGREWDGDPPAAFYGTVTAALLAARGDLPQHGSAVELDGRAVLLCGHSGAGKSTLTAALIAAGARLLSDDLSGIQAEPGNVPTMYSGRRAIRLFPDVAGFLGERTPLHLARHTGETKVLAMPPVASPDRAYPLAAVVILGDDERVQTAETAGLKLLEFSFRRRAFRHLPGLEHRVEIARSVSRAVPVLAMPGVQARSREAFGAAAETTLRALASVGVKG